MPVLGAEKWYHSNQYNAQTECGHCSGVVRHEPWCVTQNATVSYAYAAVLEDAKLSFEDQLILHALGVSWHGRACQGNCSK